MMPRSIFPRVREVKLFRPAIQAVVKNLQGLRAQLRRFARLKFAALLHDGDAEVADFAGAFLFRQHRPEFFVPKQLVRAGMKLIQVNRLDAQRPERGFKLGAHAVHGEIVVAVQETLEVMAELGRHDPARTVMPRQIVADQFFRKVIRAVAFGGVNEVDAAIRRRVEDGVGLGLRKIAAPFAAELPGAGADDGDAQARSCPKFDNAWPSLARKFGLRQVCSLLKSVRNHPPAAAVFLFNRNLTK